MHILYVTPEFAPIETTGARRPIRFVRELLKKGHKVTVLTLSLSSSKKLYSDRLESEGIEFNVNPNYNDVRLELDFAYFKQSLFNRFYFHFWLNLDKISTAWEKDIKSFIASNMENDFSCVLCNIPPFSSALSALKISKELEIPLITDFRDHWAHWGIAPFISKWHYLKVRNFERKVINGSTKVIGVTQQLIDDLKHFHKIDDENKFIVIPNSFDQNISLKNELSFLSSTNGKIRIGYVGSFYFEPRANEDIHSKWYKKKGHRKLQYTPRKEDYKYRSPYYFLSAIKKLIIEHPELSKRIEIIFVGDNHDWLKNMIIEFDLVQNVILKGRLSVKETEKTAKQFDWVLMTSLKIEKGRDYCLASKSFDYLSWGKPSLAFVANGEQKDFVQNSNAGVIFNPDKPDIQKLFICLTKNHCFKVNSDFIKQYTIENTSNELAKTLLESSN